MIENRSEHFLRDLAAPLQSMIAIHKGFRLDDGNQSSFLAQGGISSEGPCIGLNTTPAGNFIVDSNHRAPLGKPRAHLAIFGQGLPLSVQTFGYFLSGM